MSLFDAEVPARAARAPLLVSELDRVLTAQFVVAWAGENGDEERRLAWWHSDLVSRFGGRDLFHQLMPATAEWAVLQGAREAARRVDAELRRQDHDADHILSLFHLGFEVDERIEERLQELKRSGGSPQEALPELAHGIDATWSQNRFLDWIHGHGEVVTTTTPIGRRIKADPDNLEQLVWRLVAALAPLSNSYPLPHVRRAG